MISSTYAMISVVIPARNEENYIGRCLQSLLDQDYQGHFEIIVVDNGSTDNTAEIARKMGATVIQEDKKGIAGARQRGFSHARGSIIASTDADNIVPPDWLSRIQHLFRQHPGALAVAGHFVTLDGPASVRGWLKLSRLLMNGLVKFAPWLWNFSSTNVAVEKSAFEMVGGFNTSFLQFGEDIDLCRRLRRAGQVVFDSRLIMATSGRNFAADPTGIKHLMRYIRTLLRERGP